MAQTANLGLPLIDANMTADVPRDMNALAEAVDTAVTEAVEGVTVPDATTTQKGVVQLNDTTTSTNKTQAGTADAVRRAYDRGSEGVTAAAAAQSKADAAETPAGAQTKANAAETNAKNYTDGRPWQKVRVTDNNGFAISISDQDLNSPRASGWYMGSNMTNAPGSGWYYVEIIRHNDSWEVQNAYDFNKSGSFMQRTKQSGSWSAWSQDLFTSVANGKQAIATAISGKGVPASGSDEFAVLASKIGQISTGIKVASGTLTTSTATVSNLAFKPMVLAVFGSKSTQSLTDGYGTASGYLMAYNLGTSLIALENLRASAFFNNSSQTATGAVNLTNVVFGSNFVNFAYTNPSGGSFTPQSYVIFGV